jgi:hypothetical protein
MAFVFGPPDDMSSFLSTKSHHYLKMKRLSHTHIISVLHSKQLQSKYSSENLDLGHNSIISSVQFSLVTILMFPLSLGDQNFSLRGVDEITTTSEIFWIQSVSLATVLEYSLVPPRFALLHIRLDITNNIYLFNLKIG